MFGWLLSFDLFVILFFFPMFYVVFQLKLGNGEEMFPRNGRWNMNNKVILTSEYINIFCCFQNVSSIFKHSNIGFSAL